MSSVTSTCQQEKEIPKLFYFVQWHLFCPIFEVWAWNIFDINYNNNKILIMMHKKLHINLTFSLPRHHRICVTLIDFNFLFHDISLAPNIIPIGNYLEYCEKYQCAFLTKVQINVILLNVAPICQFMTSFDFYSTVSSLPSHLVAYPASWQLCHHHATSPVILLRWASISSLPVSFILPSIVRTTISAPSHFFASLSEYQPLNCKKPGQTW